MKLSIADLHKVKGIGPKTIERIKQTFAKENQVHSITQYKKTFDLPLNNFYVGESVAWMQENMPSNYVDLTVTSPPYDNLRMYKGYSFNYKNMLKELYRVTKKGGVVVWVVGDKTINGSETGTSFRQALYAMEVGFNLHDTMIYQKTSPYPANVRYQQDFEYMFVFSKGKCKIFNPLKEMKSEYEIKNVLKGQYAPETKTCRTKNGKTTRLDQAAIKRMKEASKSPTKVRSNIWKINAGYMHTTKDKVAYKHPAQFPEQLAQDHILSWSNPSDIVFDPMCGSGTVAKIAWLNNRRFIALDISKEYVDGICIPRMKEHGWPYNKQKNLLMDVYQS